ncbi:MAG: phosphotransferase [Pseudomonadales bacterium]|nr:phosphotransferase [Pseudomonadales bacterium]
MAQVLRLWFTAAGDCGKPIQAETVIYKGASLSKTRDIAARFKSLEREVAFYLALAPNLPITTPQCWSAAPSTEAEPWLLLEDLAPKAALAPPLTMGSALTLLANLHHETLENTVTPINFLSNINDLNGFIESQDLIIVERLLKAVFPASASLLPPMLSGRMTIEGVLHHPGPVLCHGDFRWDNLSAASTGCVFDWGDYCMGPPAYDLGYFLATSAQDRNQTDATLGVWIDHYLNAVNETTSDAHTTLTRTGLIQDILSLLPIIAWTPVMMLLTGAELPGTKQTYWRAVLTECEILSAQLRRFSS